MEKVLTIEPIKESKDISKKISSKQLEARITAYTILFATIIVNILWWVGTLSIQWETSPTSSLEAVQPNTYKANLK